MGKPKNGVNTPVAPDAVQQAMSEQARQDIERAKTDAAPCTGIAFDPSTGTILIVGRSPLALYATSVRLTVAQAVQMAIHTLNVVAAGIQAGEQMTNAVSTQQET